MTCVFELRALQLEQKDLMSDDMLQMQSYMIALWTLETRYHYNIISDKSWRNIRGAYFRYLCDLIIRIVIKTVKKEKCDTLVNANDKNISELINICNCDRFYIKWLVFIFNPNVWLYCCICLIILLIFFVALRYLC